MNNKKRRGDVAHNDVSEKFLETKKAHFETLELETKAISPETNAYQVNEDELNEIIARHEDESNQPIKAFSYEHLAQEYIENPHLFWDSYANVKFRDEFYKIGDSMLIKNDLDLSKNYVLNSYVCKLIRIIRNKKLLQENITAFLLVQW